MNFKHFNEDYQKPIEIPKIKIEQLKKPSMIKTQAILADKTHELWFSSCSNHLPNSKHKSK